MKNSNDMKKPHVLVIGYGIDSKRKEAVSINTQKMTSLLEESGYVVTICNIGYSNPHFFTGKGMFSALLMRRSILKRVSSLIKTRGITHILDEFVLPLSSILFVVPLIKTFGKSVVFIKEFHNDYGFSRRIHQETVLRLFANNKWVFSYLQKIYQKQFTNNKYLASKRSIPYIPTYFPVYKQPRVPMNDRRVKLCYLGHALQKKGFMSVVNSVKYLPQSFRDQVEYSFAFSSLGNSVALRSSISALFKSYGVPVHFVDSTTASQFFRENDVYILPIHDEYGATATPNTVLESMEAGCIVAVHGILSIKGLVYPGKNGYILSESSPQAVVECLMKILSNKKAAQKVSKNGREFIEQEYAYEVVRKKLLGIYEK